MKKNKEIVKISESQLHNIIAESVKKALNEGIDFSEMESWVENYSRPYENSSAFRQALSYIQKVNKKLYRSLIETEYMEGAGY